MDEYDTTVTPHGTIKTYNDGRIEVESHAVDVQIAADGAITTRIKDQIERVALDNITDVQSHRIMREGDLVVHNIEFTNGGTIDLRYKTNGDLENFSGNNVVIGIEKGNIIKISKNNK